MTSQTKIIDSVFVQSYFMTHISSNKRLLYNNRGTLVCVQNVVCVHYRLCTLFLAELYTNDRLYTNDIFELYTNDIVYTNDRIEFFQHFEAIIAKS